MRWAPVAIVAQLLILAAAVRTFVSGSPFRWWLAPLAAAFVALSAWVSRPGGSAAKRFGWAGAAAVAVAGLLTLLAVTWWLPGGELNGRRVPGRPTSTTSRAPSLDSLDAPAPAAPVVTYEQRLSASVLQPDPIELSERFARAAEEELDVPGADPADVGATAEALGHDAQTIFEFLRDRIRLEPYAGVLRGSRGTLAARAGNALDRALLAYDLLKASGIDSRLVAGTLPKNRVDRILTRFLAADPVDGPLGSCRVESEEAARTAVLELSEKAGLAPDRVADMLRAAAAKAAAFSRNAGEHSDAHFAFLADHLRQSGVGPPRDRSAALATLGARLERHYWLQVSEDEGPWTEFDPSLPDSQRGIAYGSRPAVLDDVPEDAYHRLEFSLIYHTRSQGTPEQEVLLTGTFEVADLLFDPLEFRIQPAEATADTDALLAMSARQKIADLRRMRRFQGLLRTESSTTAGRAFDFVGNTYDTGDAGRHRGSVGGLVGGALTGGEGDQRTAQFSELQVVLRLTGPGREPLTQTRTLVRAADLKNSTFAPPLLEWEILVQPQWISADLAGHQLLRHLLFARAAALENARAARERSAAGAPQEVPPPYPQQLVQLALLRQHATAGILAGQPGVTALIDQPHLTIAGHRLSALRDAEGSIIAERTIDIVENGVRFVARDRSSDAAAFEAALRQGAADATLEHRFLAEMFPALAIVSGAAVLERSQREHRPVVPVDPRELETLRRAGLPDADVEWIRANEPATARLLVSAGGAPPAAWWSVRPDGAAVLRVSGGRGQGMVEHQTDVMLIALKVQFGLICSYEMIHAGQGEPTAAKGWKLAFCTVATGASLGFLMAQAHVASWILIAIETVEFATSGLRE